MNICFIEDTHLHGGTQIWVTEATAKFIEAGEKVNVIAPDNSFVANECKNAGAEVFSYNWEKLPKHKKETKLSWINGLRNSDVAICTVHPPRNNFHCSMFAAECIKEAQLKTILVPKTGTIVPSYHREFYLPDPELNTRIIAITDFTRKYLIEEYKIPPDLIKLIYQGTDINRFYSTSETKKEAKKLYPLPKNASPIIGCIGSFEERKGQTVLLEAVKILAESKLPNIHVVLVGDGPDEEMLKEKITEMNIEKNVSFFPFTKEPNYFFEILDFLILPSLYKEGLPNVLLEAMSMSIPCIASDIAGVPEVIYNGKTGYTVPPNNITKLAETIDTMWINHETRKKMGANGRKLMEEKFDKRKQFDKFLKYFKNIIKKK